MKLTTLLTTLLIMSILATNVQAIEYDDSSDSVIRFRECSIVMDEMHKREPALNNYSDVLRTLSDKIDHEEDDIIYWKAEKADAYEMAVMWATAEEYGQASWEERRHKEAHYNVNASIDAYNDYVREKRSTLREYKPVITEYKALKADKIKYCDNATFMAATLIKTCLPGADGVVDKFSVTYCKRFEKWIAKNQ